jgi:hypothetical protein
MKITRETIKIRFFFISPPELFDSRILYYTILLVVDKRQATFSSRRGTVPHCFNIRTQRDRCTRSIIQERFSNVIASEVRQSHKKKCISP